MAVNANWKRWAVASVCKYFKDNIQTAEQWPLFIAGIDEGEDIDNPAVSSAPARLSLYAEISTQHYSALEYWMTIELTLLVTTTLSETEPFRHATYVGTLESKIPQCLELKKYGPGVDDTEELFCSLKLESDLEPKEYPAVGIPSRVSQSIYTLLYKGVINGN